MDDRKREFVYLLTKHERRIYGYILSLVPHWNDADEILQETNLRLWDEFDKYESGSDFNAWALRVAYFQVLTWRKKCSRHKLVFDDSLIERLHESQEECSEVIEARRDALRTCLESVTDENRVLLYKYYSEGQRVASIAATTNRSVQSVYKGLQRLRASLHRCIEFRTRSTHSVE